MPKYAVRVTRTSYAYRVIDVDAKSVEAAEQYANENAGDYEYSESGADYSVDYVTEISEVEG